MDVADLQLVEAVAERGSFSAAAAALRLSQPSVSARIAAVERGIGASLFLRDSRGARLTPAGERYLGYLRRSLRLLADGARAAAAETPQRPWMIGVPASYAPALAPLLIDAAARQGRAVTLRTGHSRHLREELCDGRLDLAIATPGPLPSELASRHLIDSPIVTVASPHEARVRPLRHPRLGRSRHRNDHHRAARSRSPAPQGQPRVTRGYRDRAAPCTTATSP